MPSAEANGVPDLSTALELAVPDARGEIRRLKDFHGHNVVAYFYPKDDTPGCTVEGKEFRDSYEQFQALDCAVVGVSTDSAERHRAFDVVGAVFTALLTFTADDQSSSRPR